MRNLINPLLEIEGYNKIISNIKRGYLPVTAAGMSESQKVHFAYAICSHTGKKGVFVACNEMNAKRFYEDICFFLDEGALYFPPKEILLYDVEARSHESLIQRINVLSRLIDGDFDFIVTSPEAIVSGLTGRKLFNTRTKQSINRLISV